MATKTIQSNTIFSDISTNLDIHPVRKDLLMITNENAVKRSIKNLVTTNSYERLFQPDIGGNVRSMLFENIDTLSLSQIESLIETTISNYEPRARLLNVIASSSFDDNAVNVRIVFAIVGNSKPITFDVLLERLR
jgi:phage baseplate assembly protein W